MPAMPPIRSAQLLCADHTAASNDPENDGADSYVKRAMALGTGVSVQAI